MQPRQLTILGVGLLGGSLGLAVRSAVPGCRIIGFGHRGQTLAKAREMRAIDQGMTDPAAAVTGSDWVIACTPVGIFETLLPQIAPALSPGCTVTDVGSTKRGIVALAEKHLPPSVDFVGSHPMAGSEKRGVEHARADLFRNALCILTPTASTRPVALQRVSEFWKMLGMRLKELTPEAHDRQVADISHLPHLLAAALVAMQEDDALQLRGKGFLDATRIAGGDGGLWRDIFLENADNLRQSLARFEKQIQLSLSLLEPGKSEPLRQWLQQAAQRRNEMKGP